MRECGGCDEIGEEGGAEEEYGRFHSGDFGNVKVVSERLRMVDGRRCCRSAPFYISEVGRETFIRTTDYSGNGTVVFVQAIRVLRGQLWGITRLLRS